MAEADEFTLRYMESHPELFPMSDKRATLARVRGQVQAEKLEDPLRAALIHADGNGKPCGGFSAG